MRNLLLILALLLSGCGTWFKGSEQKGESSPAELVEFTPQIQIKKLWSKNVGSGADGQYLRLSPGFSKDQLFVIDRKGTVQALSAKKGKKIWSRKTKLPVTGGVGVSEELVLFGTSEAEVVALAVETGKEVWRARVSSEVLSIPRQADSVVAVRTIDSHIFGLDKTDGSQLWLYEVNTPSLTLRGTSSPVIAGDAVIVGFDGGLLVALELQSGKIIWDTKIALPSGRSDIDRMVDIDADPVIFDETIYTVSFHDQLNAVNLTVGDLIWNRDISGYAGIEVDKTNVYIVDEENKIWALDRLSGETLWEQDSLEFRALTGPSLAGENLLVVGDIQGYLHWLDRRDGQFVGRNKVSSSPLLATPQVYREILYAYSSDGKIGAYTQHPIEQSKK